MKPGKKIKIIAALLIGLTLVAALVFVVWRLAGERKADIIKILPDEADIRIADFVYTEVGRDDIRW